ncbi:MAG: NAD(P)H-dependent oxidoreductase [Bacteroidetes bacterium]|nr:NAD(P)H-dependent oxidoreductase [Bacteroidota bacterium]HET6244303.1 NAD(P)H-dependent oxidoreductase [Bacteroidia bacterium]
MKKTNEKPRILAFAGSTRKGSFNKIILKYAVEGAKRAGAEVTVIDLKDYPMPLYDGDLEKEEGIPEKGKELFELMIHNHGFLIASPEYNSGVSGVLKNAIDWVSRPVPNFKPLAAFDGKVAAIISASPGALGGIRGLAALRAILSNIKVIVLPNQMAVPKVNDKVDETGILRDEKKQHALEAIGEHLTEILVKLNAN